VFDRLFEILSAIWHELIPVYAVDPYEGAVQLRMGALYRVREGGNWYWKIPFIDRIIPEHVVPRTERIGGLATTTIDGKAIGFDAVITYRISDIQKATLEVSDLKDAIADSCAGIIGTELSNSTWEDIVHGKTVEMLTKACRARGWKWGVEIQQVQLTGVAPVRNFRISLSGHGHATTNVGY
jgi:regulator of protease activity HflC (stomatin/prohibitin superfamily)